MEIISCGKTDVGLRRSNNEDAFFVPPTAVTFSAVADGMGGAAAGEIASRIFVDTAQEIFAQRPQSEQETYASVQEVFRLGNERIIEHVSDNPDHKGMGCTAELIGFYGDRYLVGHIGDSRTYLFRDGALRQITKDHSLVQNQLDQGLISPEDARRHPLRHIVLRALGIGAAVSMDIIRGKMQSRDIFLLCSDGLSDLIDDTAIQNILVAEKRLITSADLLIDAAKAAGGKDNITVVLCEVV
jgi:protein phosphatase